MEGRWVTSPEEPAAEETRRDARSPARRAARRKATSSFLGVAALLFLLLYLQGTLGGNKVAPGVIPSGPAEASIPGDAIPVVKREIDDVLEWPGTVRSRVTALPASKLLGRILQLRVDVGSAVRTGDVIAVLDDRDARARLRQATSARAAADAEAVPDEAESARVQRLFESGAATRRDLEAAEARATSTRAHVDQARHAVEEAEVVLSECIVRAPLDGVVSEKWAEAGDTAVPGKPLVAVQDLCRLRLEADVPESYARRASPGVEVRVRIDALGRDVAARIENIAPVADPESRTFLVKVALSAEEGIRPGMFGRFLQPWGRRPALLVPASAVRRVGQLELLHVLEEGSVRVRHVRTGKTYGNEVEVLSGVREGERILPREN